MKWPIPTAIAVASALAGVAYLEMRSTPKSQAQAVSAPTPTPQAATHTIASAGSASPSAASQPTPEARPAAGLAQRTSAEVAIAQRFERLRALPAGDAAIALGREIEAAYSAENARGYVEALLAVDNPAVERAAMSALARNADGPTLLALADQYGSLPMERRGRILQVLEGAGNPDALPALVTIVSSETHEKRSALFMSAMYGMASVGTMDSINQLLSQLSNGNGDYALMALERVHTRQGVEIIRSAAEGGKDGARVEPAMRPALQRIAQAAASSLQK
jgi:hypothetical protein